MSGRTLSTTLPFPRSSFHLHVPTHAFVVPTFKHPREYLIRSYHCSLRNLHVYAVKIRRLLPSVADSIYPSDMYVFVYNLGSTSVATCERRKYCAERNNPPSLRLNDIDPRSRSNGVCLLTPPLVSSDCVVDRGKSFLSLAEFYRQIPPENWPSCDVCSSP